MIQTHDGSIEQIREPLRKMSDAQLIEYGRAARHMTNPRRNHGAPNPAFKIQLDEARAERRRRHPKTP